jgi:hypothetical protein
MAIVDAKSSLASVIQEYGRPDIHIGAGEDESPYVPFKENVFIRHLAFDVRTNSFANILWVKKGGTLGRHRHRGPSPPARSKAAGAIWNTIGSPAPAVTSAKTPA